MKRIQLFEFEDLEWFPNDLRICMTRTIVVMHKILKTNEVLAELLADLLNKTKLSSIVDLCSGSGGPMPEVLQILNDKYQKKNIDLVLTDLYPNLEMANQINAQLEHNISYRSEPLDVSKMDEEKQHLFTMISCFHHFDQKSAKNILASIQNNNQSICIFEISDNSFPHLLNWIAFPVNIIMALMITPFVKPMTWRQLLFTYLIPILPLCFAWDGAVSNMRTYTLEDMDELLEGLSSENYIWEKGRIHGKSKKLYLIGRPATNR